MNIKTKTIQLAPGVAIDMVYIPGDTFMMGSPDREPHHEGPQHQVTVAEFWMSKYPITQAQYQASMGDNPSHFKGDTRPVEQVNWFDAMEFCARLSAHTGQIYTLPSEAQWEYACRAGTTTPFHSGETITTELANYYDQYAFGSVRKHTYREETTEVGNFPPNRFGLYDMHGNVLEWCQDYWHDTYNGAPTDGSAWVVRGSSNRRILRGGSWYFISRHCRCASRFDYFPDDRNSYIGFRVVSAAQGS